MLELLGQIPGQTKPWSDGSANSGEPSAAPPREVVSGNPAPPPHPRANPDRPILNRRAGLDPYPIKLEPSDLDPTDQIQTYPFALLFLLKSPWVLLK